MPARCIIIVFVALTLHETLCGQSAIRVGISKSFIGEDFPEERSYQVWLFSCGFAWQMLHINDRMSLMSIADVEYGAASTISGGKHDLDIAANLALEFAWQFHPSIGFFASIGSGPGYQSSESTIQAPGFTFSNNFIAGFRLPIAKKTLIISPQASFRHMSNAGVESPNKGIDNFLVGLCLSVPMKKKT